jgi:hypothetical protein
MEGQAREYKLKVHWSDTPEPIYQALTIMCFKRSYNNNVWQEFCDGLGDNGSGLLLQTSNFKKYMMLL